MPNWASPFVSKRIGAEVGERHCSLSGHAPEWGGVLAFNEFGFATVVLRQRPGGLVPKGEWTDHECRLAAEWLQRQGVLVLVEVAGQAVQTAATDHPFHP